MYGALLIATLGLALATPVDDLPGRVQQWLDSWSDLSGRFEQRLASPTLPADQVESGVFQIARPDRMRWDFRRPEKKLAVTDGVHTWLYIPSDRQVIRGRLDSLRQDSAVSLLLSGTTTLVEAFEVGEIRSEGESARLELVPRRASEAIDVVTLEVEVATGRVRGFTVVDSSGNQVTWSLTDLHLDPQLEDDLFSFRIPRGVEVQDLEEEPSADAGP